MLARRFWGSLVLAAVWLSACGSDDGKRTQRGQEAGAGGDDAAGGGMPAAEAGSGGDAGQGVREPGDDAGAGGQRSMAGAGATSALGGASQGGEGGAGGVGEPEFVIGAYVSPTGSDQEGDGTLGNPFETLTPAAAAVSAGEAIGLLDGNHIVDYFVTLPDGVALVGVNPGAATLGQMSGFNGGVTFEGSGAIDGLRIGNAVNLLQASTGTLRVTSTQFGAHGDGSGNDAALRLTGDAELVMEAPSADAPWYFEPNGGRVAQLNDGTRLSVTGGVFEGGIGGSVFFVYSGDADMRFEDVEFVDCSGGYVIALGNGGINANGSTLSLYGVTIENSGSAAGIYVGWGTPNVTISNSTIDTQNAIGVEIEGSNYGGAGAQTVTIENSMITGNSIGIRSYFYAQAALTLTDTQVDGNATGIRFQFTDNVAGSTLDMTGGSLADNTGIGFDAANETNKPIQLKLRGVGVTGNGGHGLLLYGNAGSAFDLGTFADPGNNTLQNAGASNSSAAVVVNTPTLVNAIGNTWIASQQGANASGRYVPMTGNYVEVTGPAASGQNYRIQSAGQTLRL